MKSCNGRLRLRWVNLPGRNCTPLSAVRSARDRQVRGEGDQPLWGSGVEGVWGVGGDQVFALAHRFVYGSC